MNNPKLENTSDYGTLAQPMPDSWLETELDQIANDVSYGYTAKSSSKKIGPHLLRITDIQENQVCWSGVPYCEISPDQQRQYGLKTGDLVFARTGATVGKSFLIQDEIPESVFASYLIRVRFQHGIDSKFLAHFFKSHIYLEPNNGV